MSPISNISGYGVSVINQAASSLGQAASGIAQQTVNPNEDLVSDMVTLSQSQSTVSTGVALARTADEMQKSLLDILA
jgi:hypothetical protein